MREQRTKCDNGEMRKNVRKRKKRAEITRYRILLHGDGVGGASVEKSIVRAIAPFSKIPRKITLNFLSENVQ